jgi:uncharacterized protein (DUF1501 family)
VNVILASKFQELNGVFTPFYEEMKSKVYRNNVTLVITSDFARTMTMETCPNHSLGGNYFLMVGAVRGGVIHGWVVVVLFQLLVLNKTTLNQIWQWVLKQVKI